MLQQLEDYASLVVHNTSTGRQALSAHQDYPDSYSKYYWQSRKAFREHQRCQKNNISHSHFVTLVPVGCKDLIDPLYIKLPKPSKDHLILVFRLNLSPSSRTYLAVLFQLPAKSVVPPDAPFKLYPEAKMSSEVFLCDIGCQRFQLGLCSGCGTKAKLYACAGCKQHSYCSRACQRSLWKQHKPLCRHMQNCTKKGDLDDVAAELQLAFAKLMPIS